MFHSTALMVIGIYLLFMAAAGYYVRFFGGSWGRPLQVALVFAALLALGAMAISASIRAKLRVIVSKHFFSYRYDYRDEWLRFTHALSARGGQTELRQDVIKGLADMLESPAGSLWLLDGAGRHFVQAARWNMPADAAAEPCGSAFAQFLMDTGWVVNLEEYRSSPDRYRGLRIPFWLTEVPNAWLIIPLANGGELIGFVILATARTRVDVNWEVNDLLKTAARQAATFLGQMQATEALLEARKFDAFNRMSAFVVHDLKNIVAQLSLMLKNAERHRENPEFQKDMLITVEHSVERAGSGNAGWSCGSRSWSGGCRWTARTRARPARRSGSGRRSAGGPGRSPSGSAGRTASAAGSPVTRGKACAAIRPGREDDRRIPQAECRIVQAGLGGGGSGRPRWAQVIDVEILADGRLSRCSGPSCAAAGRSRSRIRRRALHGRASPTGSS